MKKSAPLLLLLLLLSLSLSLSACGYFNSLYNARKQFSTAERQRQEGDIANARQSYIGSIEKAAKSYRRYPASRWSDDALYLIARARFQLNELPAARAAFAELLATSTDAAVRAGAHAFAGATETSLAAPQAGLIHLDSALAFLADKSELSGFAHLWRARARFATGDLAGAWQDLDEVTSPHDPEYGAVQLERIALAIAAKDNARAAAAFAAMLRSRDFRRELDTLATLAGRASAVFGAPSVRVMLAQSGADLPAPARDSLMLIRGRIATVAGDTAEGHRELLQVADRAALPTASAARVVVARSRLLSVRELDGLSEVRALLLPAITHSEAQTLIRAIRLVEVLVQRSAETGQPLALFTAAEIARDDLGAPKLARKLFVTFVDFAPQTPWAGKALLAAIAIAPNAPVADSLRARVEKLPPNPYTAVTRGETVLEAYETAEARLSRSMVALREEAVLLAAQRETGVTRALAVLDSVAAAARTDTLRIACGTMLDTLALKGVRADSVRGACMRRDTALVAAYLKVDTATWLPGYVADSTQIRLRNRRNAPKTPAKDSIK